MITVIVPVFNALPFLSDCIGSIVAQTYPKWEMIIVDDGSEDGSCELCMDFSERDNRIKFLSIKQRGPGAARNKGLEHAAGDYVYFLDSDDWIAPNTFEKTITFAKKYDCDIVQNGFCYAFDRYGLVRKQSLREKVVISRDEALRELILQRRIQNFSWGKLYKKKIVDTLRFPDLRCFEDFQWTQNAIDQCQRYGFVNEMLYFYRQRKDSITGSLRYTDERYFESMEERCNFFETRYPELYPLMKQQYDRMVRDSLTSRSCKHTIENLFRRVKSRLYSPYEKIKI